MERHGALGDGGKWVCGLSRVAKKPDCVVYSFGKVYFFSFFFFFFVVVGLLKKENYQASITSHRSKRRSYPIPRIVKFGDMILVSDILDLKFRNRLNIVLISTFLDFRDLINMHRGIYHLCIHLRPL